MNATRTHRTDEEWVEEFVMALRMREVPGPRIGDLVAEVRSHCAESGESAEEAFGLPRAYAASRIAELRVQRTSAMGWVRSLSPTILGLAGLYLALPAAPALRTHEPVQIPWSFFAALVLLALVAAVLVRFGERLVARRGAFIAGAMVAFAALVALPIVWTRVAINLSPVAAATTAAVLLVASVVGGYTWGRVHADPAIDPRTGRDSLDDARGARAGRRILAIQPWMYLATALVFGALMWLFA